MMSISATPKSKGKVPSPDSASPRRAVQIRTTLGPLLLIASSEGLTGVHFADGRYVPPIETTDDARTRDPVLRTAIEQLRAYFEGRLRRFDLPLAAAGTAFQTSVWIAIAKVDYGATASYQDIARSIRAPSATRAVGAATGRNPLSLVVPCHRIVGSDGSITGYAGGLDRKRALLELERR